MGMKLMLDSGALSRLLDGHPELEVAMSAAAVNGLMHTHFKPVIESLAGDVAAALGDKVKVIIGDEIAKTFPWKKKDGTSWHGSFQIPDDLRKEIHHAVHTEVSAEWRRESEAWRKTLNEGLMGTLADWQKQVDQIVRDRAAQCAAMADGALDDVIAERVRVIMAEMFSASAKGGG